ncbi:hypothetical protein OH77DRAFT_1424326 [Trametes cingulata]|nr:hypothetical protein OH77DRAFT_1424326 [Trametes cingulata]
MLKRLLIDIPSVAIYSTAGSVPSLCPHPVHANAEILIQRPLPWRTMDQVVPPLRMLSELVVKVPLAASLDARFSADLQTAAAFAQDVLKSSQDVIVQLRPGCAALDVALREMLGKGVVREVQVQIESIEPREKRIQGDFEEKIRALFRSATTPVEESLPQG